MTDLIKSVTDAGLGLGSLILMAYLIISNNLRQDKKDKAYIETLVAIQSTVTKVQTDLDANWKATRDVSDVVHDSAKALSKIKCLQ